MTKFEWAGTTYVEYIIQMQYSNNALRRKTHWKRDCLVHIVIMSELVVCACVCVYGKRRFVSIAIRDLNFVAAVCILVTLACTSYPTGQP